MTTLKNLVDETTNIKNELITCHSNLKNNLIEKGVECSDNDKMSSLIDKVNSLSNKTIASDNYRANYEIEGVDKATMGANLTGIRRLILIHHEVMLDGSIRLKYTINNDLTKVDYTCNTWIYHVRNGELINTIQKDVKYKTNLTIIQDLEVKKEDIVFVIAYGPTSSTSYGSCYASYGFVGYDFV